MSDFSEKIKYVELDNNGSVKRVLGVCKASDFKKPVKLVNVDKFWDSDVFLELGIRRMDL